MTREATNKLLEMVEDGLIDKDVVIIACVKYMSEDDVSDMCHCNEFFQDDDEPEYTYSDEDEVRGAFWEQHPQYAEHGDKRQNDCPVDVRVAFVDFVDGLQKSGEISEDLAQEVTL